ncbi:hypothetical protein [Halothiobacillus sp.]|uniref:hypothetical protein n=1 Tax=Halothiobacillus sp. TaxID=1891311 RepID=UPI00262B8A59|nr:hypothetical protein [Halothiobacillus sp.]
MRRVFTVSASLATIRLDSSPITASTVYRAFSRFMSFVSTMISCAGYLQTKTRGLLVYGSLQAFAPRTTVPLIRIRESQEGKNHDAAVA